MSQKTVDPASRQARQVEYASGRSKGWSDVRRMGLRSEFGLLGKPDRVPVKMQKAIRALRERCLVTDRFGQEPRLERVVEVDRGGEVGPLGANQWYGGEPTIVLRKGYLGMLKPSERVQVGELPSGAATTWVSLIHG